MSYIDELNRHFKYVTERKEDFYPSLMEPAEGLTPHKAFSDYLEERGEDDPLLHQLRSEIAEQEANKEYRSEYLDEPFSHHDIVLHAIRTGHPSPTARALANLLNKNYSPKTSNQLIDLLLNSPYSADKDAAVWMADEDSPKTYSTHHKLNQLNTNENDRAGLQTKVVRGKAFLLDYNHPDRRYAGDNINHWTYNWGAPAIVHDAPVNDSEALDKMKEHAHQIAESRAGVGMVV